MSVSIYIHGMTAPDEKFNKLKAVYNACIAAGLEIPYEVESYFDGEDPNELEGADVDIDCAIIKGQKYHGSDFTVEIAKLPECVKFIRFYMS